VVSARIIADTVEVAPQAMLVDACAAWRVARDEHTSIDLLAGARVAGASEQIDFGRGDEPGKGAGLLAYAWFVWEQGYTGEPMLAWL
jgi:hypothetical protein